jgi:glycosyltransferase involved in cell wall biosynthesis
LTSTAILVAGDSSLKTTPRVTVIIAAYNCSHTLKCALATVLGQTYSDFEVRVVGDGCTDDSEQVVAASDDPRVHWFNLPQRVGSQSGPNNEGLRRARGDCIAYLGQDDLWFPWHLESLLATMEETKADCVNGLIAVMRPGRGAEGCSAPSSNFTQGRSIPPSCWLHRREIIEKCGPWPLPVRLTSGVDFILQRRAFLAGFSFAATGQLSVIKFPSPAWKTYARLENNPQPSYLARMQEDSSRLHREVLTEIVVEAARRREHPDLRDLSMSWLRTLYWRVVDGYGRDRWPVNAFLGWREQRWRHRVIRLRGLSRQP